MKDKLQIIIKLKKTYEYVSINLENYPHKYLDLKERMENDLLNMIELAYLANLGVDRENNQLKVISKIYMVDYYLKLSYKKELISKKKYEGVSRHLLEINNMINSWIKSNEENE